MSVSMINHVITSADGKSLKFVDKVTVHDKIAGVHTNNFLTIFIRDLEDPDQPGVSTLDRIKEFLTGDLSILNWEYDLYNNRKELIIEHRTEQFKGFSTNVDMMFYTPKEKPGFDRYKIILKCTDDEYNKAMQDREDIIMLFNAIADTYESVVI